MKRCVLSNFTGFLKLMNFILPIACFQLVQLNQKKAWLLYHEAVAKYKDVQKDVGLSQGNVEKKRKEYEKYNSELRKLDNNIKSLQQNFAKTVSYLGCNVLNYSN